MAKRYPEVNDLGLVVPPVFDACEAECCQLAQAGRECRPSQHHVYWPRRRYTSPVAKTFRLRPENIVGAPRCTHNDYHRTFTEARMPDRDVMLRFIQESKLLESLGVLSHKLAQQMQVLEERGDTPTEEVWERIGTGIDTTHDLALQVVNFQVVPAEFAQAALVRYGFEELVSADGGGALGTP